MGNSRRDQGISLRTSIQPTFWTAAKQVRTGQIIHSHGLNIIVKWYWNVIFVVSRGATTDSNI